jgi:transcriptional regulator with XRE-family HTH domain
MVFATMEKSNKLLEILQWAVSYMGWTQAKVGEILDIKQPAASLLLSGKRTVKPVHIKKMAEYIGITPESLLEKSQTWNKTESPQPSAPVPGNLTHIDQQHADVIRQFKNRELALEINSELVGLEYIDPSRLEKVLDYIKEQKELASFKASQKKRPGTASGE